MKWTLPVMVVAATALASPLPPAFAAMTDAECSALWSAADVNKDGMVTQEESARTFAQLRVADLPVADGRVSNEAFLAHCKAGVLTIANAVATDPGAPLPGANSFTEEQARDRILAAGLSSVSALVKDGDGIWRGTASDGTTSKTVAVDYKGNVVAQ